MTRMNALSIYYYLFYHYYLFGLCNLQEVGLTMQQLTQLIHYLV